MAVVEANEMQRLQSEIDALQEQLAELQRQKLQLEEQQQQHLESAGTDWKLIHEATKWSGNESQKNNEELVGKDTNSQ